MSQCCQTNNNNNDESVESCICRNEDESHTVVETTATTTTLNECLERCNISSSEEDKTTLLEESTTTTMESTPAAAAAAAAAAVVVDSQQSNTKRRRRRVVKRKNGSSSSRRSSSSIPSAIVDNVALKQAIATSLPSDYEFEIEKTIWRIQQQQGRHVALQLPEGLLLYSCILADILQTYAWIGTTNTNTTKLQVSILGDVTYGACCIDDIGAKALGADLLVHYGHSCLVPLTTTVIPCLYVFVELSVDVLHMVQCVQATHLPPQTHIHVMGTVQFRSAVNSAAKMLMERNISASIPQAKPLSPGEVLGCTAPDNLATTTNKNEDVMLFVADGRFHLEAAMMANPTLRALRYDPYSKTLTDETYNHQAMRQLRQSAIHNSMNANTFGIILGTLGRQGNPAILSTLCTLLQKHNKRYFVILLSEIFPSKLQIFHNNVDAWVQIACPRLSVDWGHAFTKPLLNTFELHVVLGEATLPQQPAASYPMDYYKQTSGPWSNYHDRNRTRKLNYDTSAPPEEETTKTCSTFQGCQ